MKTRGVLRWHTAGLLLAVLVIVALPYAVTRFSSQSMREAAALLTHSNVVKATTYRLAYLTRDSESAIYRLLAGDSNDLTQQRKELAGREVPALLRQLRAMTRDNPDQQVRIGALENAITGRITLMNQASARLQQGDPAGARQSLRDAGDLFVINDDIAGIVQAEDNLLESRQVAAHRQAFNNSVVLGVTALAQLLLLGIIVVMSERQIGQRQLAETREGRAVRRSRLIFQAVREPIALFDEKLNSLLVNNAFAELYGMDSQHGSVQLEQIGDGAWSDTVLLQRLNDVLLLDRELWDHDMIQRTADGTDRHVVINARRLQPHDTETPALLLTVSDITTRALAEQKVNELNRQLEGKITQLSDVNRELEAFSYSVSHDLRAPLRHISGFARKLEQHLGDRTDDKTTHYIDVISSSAQRMALLIDDLLVFSRLGRGALRLQAVDMQSLVEEARALSESAVPERRIAWSIEPLPMVIADENMLRTVWQNLLGNAVKYTGHCDVARIEVSVKQDRRGDYEFTVADNGAGFDMQFADKLFGVFQRLHRNSEFPGNGIGLANVRRIIARHGGRVWAEAEPGQGARFHFSLPATDTAGAHT
ncbi:ATP-binding protein [Rhodanobacter sp. T12-5]|uniref:sensor histidine kinase n=1 Tax=Rhodanobacter sp. T12-5 TaxID=2024611 RepID=UPI0011EEBE74|nr:ATP-binding protein [Rhodanobacter sp. T12-5]KAA0071201.1 PAS domain S-box protein [Rhodanobacter sp. T12-5]